MVLREAKYGMYQFLLCVEGFRIRRGIHKINLYIIYRVFRENHAT